MKYNIYTFDATKLLKHYNEKNIVEISSNTDTSSKEDDWDSPYWDESSNEYEEYDYLYQKKQKPKRYTLNYSIDFTNDFELYNLKKQKDSSVSELKDDTALFHQLRQCIYKDQTVLDSDCLLNHIFVLDFGNLFLKVGKEKTANTLPFVLTKAKSELASNADIIETTELKVPLSMQICAVNNEHHKIQFINEFTDWNNLPNTNYNNKKVQNNVTLFENQYIQSAMDKYDQILNRSGIDLKNPGKSFDVYENEYDHSLSVLFTDEQLSTIDEDARSYIENLESAAWDQWSEELLYIDLIVSKNTDRHSRFHISGHWDNSSDEPWDDTFDNFDTDPHYNSDWDDLTEEEEQDQNPDDLLPYSTELSDYERLRMMIDNGIYITYYSTDSKQKVIRRFVPFDKSQSMARASKITYIDEQYLYEINRRLTLDLDFGYQKISSVISKYLAYRGLYLSSGQRIDLKALYQSESEKEIPKISDLATYFAESIIVIPDGSFRNDDTTDDPSYITGEEVSSSRNPESNQENMKYYIHVNGTEKVAIDTMFDGEGIISPQFAQIIDSFLLPKKSENLKATSFQIRMPFIKGMLHQVDFHDFLETYTSYKNNGPYYITDCFQRKRDLKKAQIILTKSMFKASDWLNDWVKYEEEVSKQQIPGSMDPMLFYFEKFFTYDHALYISGTNLPYYNKDLITLNYQFINPLCFGKSQAEDFQRLIQYHNIFVKDPYTYLKRISNDTMDNEEAVIVQDNSADLYDFSSDLNNEESESAGESVDEATSSEDNMEISETAISDEKKYLSATWLEALFANKEFIYHPYIKSKLQSISKSLKQNLALGRILVDGEIRFLSRDLLYFLFMLVQDSDLQQPSFSNMQNELLKQDQFEMPNPQTALQDKQYYPIFRSPHLSRNEECALRFHALKKENFKTPSDKEDILKNIRYKYFHHLSGIIMVSHKSFAPDTLGGADFDGDIVKIVGDISDTGTHSSTNVIRDAVLKGAYGMLDDEIYNPEKIYKRVLPIIKIPQRHADLDYSFGRPDFEIIDRTFSNHVGLISNMAIRMGQIEYSIPDFYNLYKDENDFCYSCSDCTILTGLEIDACKTGYHPNLNHISSFIKNSLENTSFSYIDQFLRNYNSLLKYKGYDRSNQATANILKHLVLSYQNKYANTDIKLDDLLSYITKSLGNIKKTIPTVAKEKVEMVYDKSSNYSNLSMLSYFFFHEYLHFEPKETIALSSHQYFKFEKDDSLRIPLNETKLQKIIYLIKAYRDIKKFTSAVSKKIHFLSQESYQKCILQIMNKQYDSKSTLLNDYTDKCQRILDYFNCNFKNKEEIQSALNRLNQSEWPYLTNDDEKIRELQTILNFQEINTNILEPLTVFQYRGYQLLYLFLKKAESQKELEDIEYIIYSVKEKSYQIPILGHKYESIYQFVYDTFKQESQKREKISPLDTDAISEIIKTLAKYSKNQSEKKETSKWNNLKYDEKCALLIGLFNPKNKDDFQSLFSVFLQPKGCKLLSDFLNEAMEINALMLKEAKNKDQQAVTKTPYQIYYDSLFETYRSMILKGKSASEIDSSLFKTCRKLIYSIDSSLKHRGNALFQYVYAASDQLKYDSFLWNYFSTEEFMKNVEE